MNGDVIVNKVSPVIPPFSQNELLSNDKIESWISVTLIS